MPKKPNFLGGMQNYNPNNGEYEPNLVGSNGKVVKDADGDGVSHESRKDYQGTIDKLNKEFGLDAEKGFQLAKTDDPAYDGVNILHPTGYGMTPNELEYALEHGTLKGYDELSKKREDAMRKGTFETDDYDEINEALADYQYEITDKTTVGDYAQRIAEKTGKSKEEVLSVLKESSGKEFKETDKMSIVADLEEEQDFNDPSESAHNKAEEKEFSSNEYERKTDRESNEDVDWDLAQKNERINGSKAKSKTRKDKYGNPLISDEAFKVGQEVSEPKPDVQESKQEVKYPKGTSKEYTDEVNASYNKALPVLEKAGIKLEEFKGETNSRGGFDTNAKEIMDKYVFNPFREKYPNGNNDAWDREYKELYDAIETVLDKQYNDWYIKNAPYGY